MSDKEFKDPQPNKNYFNELFIRRATSFGMPLNELEGYLLKLSFGHDDSDEGKKFAEKGRKKAIKYFKSLGWTHDSNNQQYQIHMQNSPKNDELATGNKFKNSQCKYFIFLRCN